MTDTMTAVAVLDRLQDLYDQSVANLRQAVGHFLQTGERADPEARAKGLFAYPQLKVSWFGERPTGLETRSYARLSRPGAMSPASGGVAGAAVSLVAALSVAAGC